MSQIHCDVYFGPVAVIKDYKEFELPDGDELVILMRTDGEIVLHPNIEAAKDAITGDYSEYDEEKYTALTKEGVNAALDWFQTTFEPILSTLQGTIKIQYVVARHYP